MVYNIATTVSYGKEELLEIVDDLAVYAYFLGFKPLLNRTYISPLRSDKSPSFSLFCGKNGHILWKDFGSGESGDCIKFVSKLTNKTSKESISEILQIFVHNKPVQQIKRKTTIVPKSHSNIEIKIMPYDKVGLDYWKSYGIDLDILNKYEVYQVKKVWTNDEIKAEYTKDNPIFAYKLYDRLKIYRPLNGNRRFFTNANEYYIQGWKQLNRSNNVLILTKALKDVMLFDKLGYSAVAPNGEGYTIPSNIVSEMQNSFSKVIVFYDRDRTGILNTRKLFKDFGFDFKFIPKKYKAKDLTDFYALYGEQETKQLLSNLLQNGKSI